MPENGGEKLNRIEEMQKVLFSRSYKTQIKHRNSFSDIKTEDVPDSWDSEVVPIQTDDKFAMHTSVFKKFFIFSIVFFLLASGYAAYMFFAGGNTVSNDNIDISVIGNTFTAGGEDLPLIVEITNRNNSPLELVDLVTEYPKSSSGSSSGDTERMRESLGTIPAGGVKSEGMKVVLFGEQGTTRVIKISIEYRVEGSNAIFVKEKTYEVAINSSPIDLTFDAPKEVSSNQDMVLKVKAVLNANKVVSKVLLKVDYPVGFEFSSAKPAPTLGDNIWSLEDLAPGAEREITILGKMIDVSDGEEKIFRVWSGTESKGDKSAIGVVFNSLSNTITIRKPSLEAKLYIGGVYQREYTSGPREVINGEIRWVNNLDTKINDLVIRAKFSGNAVDRKSIKGDQGFYDSSQDTIIWDKNSQRGFGEVNPGESGSLMFSFSPTYSTTGGGANSDPYINVEVSIDSKQSGGGSFFDTLSNKESKVIKITSNVGFASKALYYSGAFKNTGPIPPKPEKETTYTVVWSLSNTSNNVSKAQVRATLPSWAHFVGPVSPKLENVTYDSATKEIVWSVGNLPKGAGVTKAEREVSFQVAILPSLSQIGTSPAIINSAVLTGHDDFANVDVVVNKSSLDIRLINDASLPINGDRVTE